jgi:hypothetical protein
MTRADENTPQTGPDIALTFRKKLIERGVDQVIASTFEGAVRRNDTTADDLIAIAAQSTYPKVVR